jgi:tetratricopeptide (TPR) repeat protein
MSESKASVIYSRSGAGLGIALLLAALVAAYANHFHNGFHFDDAHTIENNAAIRDLRNIPLFFRDAATFSSLPSNQSYRPLVSTLLAINYSLGHGLRPFWFHLSIFVFFAALILLLAFVIHHLLDRAVSSPRNGWIALAAAALYGLHPANADTVNYIIASSEVLSTLGVIASFAIYFGFPNLRRYYVYVLPAAIAVLAKPTAAIFPALFAIYCLLFPESCSHSPAGRRRLTETWLQGRLFAYFIEIIPSFLICAAMLLFVQYMTPHSWIAGAANTHNYLITQPYVALLYLKTFFWPTGLSADYDLNAFTTTGDPRFWAGLGFFVVFMTLAIVAAIFKKARLIGFGLLWFLIALLPTSLFPLAEVMNDHRTFLPYIGLVIALAGAVSVLMQTGIMQRPLVKTVTLSVASLLLCESGYATFQRNKVWKTEETLWRDVTVKSPNNGRGLMNYGNTLMAKGDYTGALDYFHRAQRFTPQYSVLFINLAVAEDATKQDAIAEQHFKQALQLAPSSPDSYTYYARYLIARARTAEAQAMLHRALELSPTDLTAQQLFAQTSSQTKQTPESYLAASLQFYREERYVDCIAASQAALALRPDYPEAWNNIGAAYNKLGRYKDAEAACEQALRLKPDFELARNNLNYAKQRLAAMQPN